MGASTRVSISEAWVEFWGIERVKAFVIFVDWEEFFGRTATWFFSIKGSPFDGFASCPLDRSQRPAASKENKIERMKRDMKTVFRNANRQNSPLWIGVYNSDNRNKRNRTRSKTDTSLPEIANGGGLILKTRKV